MSGQSVIVDGATNETAEVTSKRRLMTQSVTFTSDLESSIEGNHFNIGPATFPVLTSDTESALVYLKNDEPEQVPWAMTFLTIVTGASTDGVGDWSLRFLINPVAGTIITAGTDSSIVQMNAGIVRGLSATAKTGAEGLTIDPTISEVIRLVPSTPTGLTIPLDAVIIPPGGSIGISATPPAGNTSLKLDFGISIIRLTDD